MLSRISSIALLSLALTASAALAQSNTNVTAGHNAVNEALRAQENQTARQNDETGPAVRPGELGPLDPRPENPTIDPGVYEPTDFTISGYGRTEVGLRWWNRGGPQTRIYRSTSGGPWALLQALGPQPVNAYVDFQDHGASINAENCYRVSVWDGVNSFSTKTSPIRCAFTLQDEVSEDAVNRLQLRIQIASAADADTDNTIEVRLQSPRSVYASTNWSPAGNSTWVDSTADDFERLSNRTYDLLVAGVHHSSDVTQITLAKPGDDDVCIAGLELFVDGASAFSRTYGNSTNQCQWIHGNDVLSINFADLRTQQSWINLQPNTFLGFDGPGLRSVIEAKFGHFLHGRGELDNGQVLTSRADEGRLNVAVPVTIYDVPVLGDVDSIVRFDLVLTRANGETQLSIENADANSSDLFIFISPFLSAVILHGVSEEIEGQIEGMGSTTVGGAAFPGTHPCFMPDGGLGLCRGD